MSEIAPVKHLIEKYISDSSATLDLYNLNGTIDEIISKFQTIKEKVLSLGFSEVKFYTRQCDESTYFEIYGVRMQTDEEYQKELISWQKRQQQIEIRKSKASEREKKC